LIFADTSALYATLVHADRRHADAQRAEASLRGAREELWTIDPVLTELWLLLNRAAGQRRADASLIGLLDAGLRREVVAPEDYLRAWQFAREWPDQRFALTDRQAFAVMERTRRYAAWSYDDDFAVVRLGRPRARALDLVR
jgi:predicted nucleic acid-binding protein